MKCLNLKKFKQYSATIKNDVLGTDELEKYFENKMNVQFMIKLASKKRNVFEEVLIFDEIGLVGSLGGSFGLFVGFSFFGCITPILDSAFNKVADLFQCLNQPNLI